MTIEPISKNIVWQETAVTPGEMEALTGHKGATLWFTGLPASGKSTLANAVARTLADNKIHCIVLDGDNIRHGLNRNLGFSKEDREENIRRIAEVAKLFTSAAVINLTAFVSPYRRDRDMARALQPKTFVEVYCKASLVTCERRDPKGLYKRARAGEIRQFTGIDDPYELPEDPEIIIDTEKTDIDSSVAKILAYLATCGIVDLPMFN